MQPVRRITCSSGTMNDGESAQAVSLPPQALSNDTARKRLLLTKSPEPKVESLASSEDDSAKDSNPFLSKALGTRKFDKPSSLSLREFGSVATKSQTSQRSRFSTKTSVERYRSPVSTAFSPVSLLSMRSL